MFNRIKKFIAIAALGLSFYSCNMKTKTGEIGANDSGGMGVLNVKTQFYDTNGNVNFNMPMKIWYRDSVSIQEVLLIKSVTDTSERTTVSYIPQFYRYIDLKNNSWYEYRTFNDTSQLIKSGVLPDTIFQGGGWTFYANHLPMKNEPQVLPDTTIGQTTYMRIKFAPVRRKLNDSYIIGYLRCDGKAKLFSFEKPYSHKVNCTMTRYYEFKDTASKPFVSNELEFLSDTLSIRELKVFEAWGANQRRYPVR